MRTGQTNLRIGRRPAFSLVELLVVIGIISLLIGIALPAFSQARLRVKIASTQQLLENTIGTGLATFRADQQFGGSLPPSAFLPKNLNLLVSPHTGDNTKIDAGGASFVVWALAGADLGGTPGFRDLDGIDPAANNPRYKGIAPWANDMGSDPSQPASNLYAVDTTGNGKPFHSRAGAYVDTSKVKFPKMEGGRFVVPAGVSPHNVIDSICFLDAWDQPVLYYRAYAGNGWMVNDQFGNGNQGIYNIQDNWNITGNNGGKVGLNLGAGNKHFVVSTSGDTELGHMTGANTQGVPPPRGSFGFTVWNPSVTANYRPHNPDSFILLSAGPDGLYGTPDDIANFPVNK